MKNSTDKYTFTDNNYDYNMNKLIIKYIGYS